MYGGLFLCALPFPLLLLERSDSIVVEEEDCKQDLVLVAEIDGKPKREATRSDACECKLEANVVGTPPAMLEVAGMLIVDLVRLAESTYLMATTTEAEKRQGIVHPEC